MSSQAPTPAARLRPNADTASFHRIFSTTLGKAVGHGLPVRIAVLHALKVLLVPPLAGGEEAKQSALNGPLDGMAFSGKVGPAGFLSGDDVLYFDKGQFWSNSCTRCGIAPGGYWVRNVDGGIEFRGEVKNPDRGQFFYLGTVRDGRDAVTIKWRKQRWYWSINRDFHFEGALVKAIASTMTVNAARLASAHASPKDCGL